MILGRRFLLLSTQNVCNTASYSGKPNPFVENAKLVKSRAVKAPPKYPAFATTRKSKTMAQTFDYLLVLDFEATCQENFRGPMLPVQEIIEFPVVQLSTSDWSEIRRFHKYIRPTQVPRLTSFCTSLTGIIQEMVDDQPTLPEVLTEFDTWLKQDPRLKSDNYAFVTCGDWDLKVALPNESKFKQITIPDYFSNWINVKVAYAEHTNTFVRGMTQLLKAFNLQLQGRQHSGIDDVTNICEIVRCLGRSGHDFRLTGSTTQTIPRRVFRKI